MESDVSNATAEPARPGYRPWSPDDGGEVPATRPSEADVIQALCTVYDPEIPVNIYELGLVYDVTVHDDGKVEVLMTLTSPGCPVAVEMPGYVEAAVAQVDKVTSVQVDITWDPPWTADMMSEAARLELGFM
ncbi:MAG: SUF system Fe-S cluster assembly protein [Alphaproteobacteria bacterium]